METAPLEIQDLLGKLGGEGHLESTGAFTVDLAHAIDKLQRYQLEDRASHYILKLVQGGVAAGARAIHLHSTAHRVSLRMEGVSLPPRQLESLFYHLLFAKKEASTRHLRALAVGLNSAIGIGAREISLTSWDGQSGVRQLWSKHEPSQTPHRSSGGAFLEFNLIRSRLDEASNRAVVVNLDIFDMLFHKRAAMDQEQAAVWDSCRLCAVPITINGRTLERQPFGAARFPGCPSAPSPNAVKPRHALSFLAQEDPDYYQGINVRHHLIETYVPALAGEDLPTLTTARASGASLVKRFIPGEPYRFAVGVPVQVPSQVALFFAEDGVLISGPTYATNEGFGGIALLCGSQFDKDLSEFKVTVNDRYQKTLEEVCRIARELNFEILQHLDLYPLALAESLKKRIGVKLR